MGIFSIAKRGGSGRGAVRWAICISIMLLLASLILSGCKSTDKASNTAVSVTNGNSSTATEPSSVVVKTRAYDPSVSIAVPEGLWKADLETIDGKKIKLSDYAGKVVILNLWATWCQPCRVETPDLIELSGEYKDKGVQVIGIATQENESQGGIQGVKDFARGYKIPYEMVYTDGTFTGPLVQLVNGRAVIPQSFVLSKSGKFVAHFSGFSPTQTPPKLRAVIDQAVAETPQG
jgi:thiol-disulfide isomerase/thioredoxin